MIEKARFRNLQVYLDRTVTFGPNVTVITGVTNAGKSTIIRGLELLALNRQPKGTYRRGGKPVKVSAKIDGKWVTRVAGKKHSYLVGGKSLKAAGKRGEVPKAVRDLLQLCPDNFQRQRDPAFWFADTPGQVSKALNAVVDLGVIDRCLANAAGRVRKAKAELDISAERLKAAKVSKSELSWAVGNAEKVDKLVHLYTTARNLRRKAESFAELLQTHRNHCRVKIRAGRAANAGRTALAVGRRAEAVRERVRGLETLLSSLREQKALMSLRPPDVKPLVALRARADAVAERRRGVELLLREYREAKGEACRLRKRLKVSRAKLETVKVCPACGQPTPKKYSQSSHRTGISV